MILVAAGKQGGWRLTDWITLEREKKQLNVRKHVGENGK